MAAKCYPCHYKADIAHNQLSMQLAATPQVSTSREVAMSRPLSSLCQPVVHSMRYCQPATLHAHTQAVASASGRLYADLGHLGRGSDREVLQPPAGCSGVWRALPSMCCSEGVCMDREMTAVSMHMSNWRSSMQLSCTGSQAMQFRGDGTSMSPGCPDQTWFSLWHAFGAR